jgi:sortase A
VTWFSGIGRLRPGDVLRYVTPCRTYTFQVTAHHVVAAGSPVYTTVASTLVLDTCYPFNALYLTSTRYLVYASLTGASPTHPLRALPPDPQRPLPPDPQRPLPPDPQRPLPPGPPAPRVPAPAPLVAQGLGLDHNDAPLGALTITGSPSASWRQSSAPLTVERVALEAYFGAIRSAEQGQRSWWADLAPAVPVSAAAPLWGGELSGYDSALDIALRVDGGDPAGATLTAVTETRTAAGAVGAYTITVRETISTGRLLVTGFSMKSTRLAP